MRLIATVCAFLLIGGIVYADKIFLKAGNVLEGRIIETGDQVRIDVNGLTYEIAKERIEKIVMSAESDDLSVGKKQTTTTAPPVDATVQPVSRKQSNSSAGVLTVASAAITGVLLTANNTKKTQDDAAARRAQAQANLSAAFGGEPRTVDRRLYETEEERFSSAVIVMMSLGVGVVVGAILGASSSSSNDTSTQLRPYFDFDLGKSVAGGIAFDFR